MTDRQPKNAVSDAGELMIYGVVGDEWDGLNAAAVVKSIQALGDVDAITIRINSPGGYVYEGLAIYNFLAAHKARKIVHIDGVAASMASVIAMVGDEIHMPENALMMIHNPWNIVIGDADAMRKEAETLDKVKGSLLSIYAGRTGKGADELSAMLDAETWLNGADALEQGFATHTGDAVDAKALAVDLSILNLANSPPDALRVAGAKIGRAMVAAPSRAAEPITPKEMVNMTEVTVPAATPSAVDAEALVKAERTRAAAIRKAVRAVKLDESFADEMIEGGLTVEQASAKILDKLASASDALDIVPVARTAIVADASDKFRAGATSALLARSGFGKDDAGNEFRGLSLRELAREALESRNISTRGMRTMDMVKAAMTHSTSDFTGILANVAEKAMMRGYEEADETFQRWTYAGTLTDFKPASRVDLNAYPNLPQVAEGGEYTYATIGERGETIALATYGSLFSITRQAIINDDLSVFTRIPQRMGRAAVRTVGNLVYAILTSNPTMSDGKALFHADHKNLGTGAGSALSVTSLDAARAAMAVQKDRSGNSVALNISPAYLLVPAALRGTAQVLMTAEFDPAKTQRTPNMVANMAEVISDARLDAASATSWYLAANPTSTDTVEVAYLDGVQTPVLEQMDGWKVDGVEFKVRMDAGVKALAWEGMYKAAGA